MAFGFSAEEGTILGSIAAAVVAAALFARKYFVNWKAEEVTLAGTSATSAMMANFHKEIERLAKLNTALSEDNTLLRRQVSRLEALIELMAVRFGVDFAELEAALPNPHPKPPTLS